MKRMVLCGAALLLAATACGQQVTAPQEPGGGGNPPVTEETPTEAGSPGEDAPAEGTHVLNRHGDEQGFDDQRPEEFVATEFTTFSDLEWDEWSDEAARGEGEVSGTWCLDLGCQDEPYDVQVELGEPVDVGGTAYFSTYSVTDGEMPEEARGAMEEADGGQLALPAEE